VSGLVAFDAPLAWRQSDIATFDACPLSLGLRKSINLRQLPGQIGNLGARGVLFHRFAAAAIEHMREHQERSIDVAMAMELLAEVIAQRDVADEDVVHLPLADMRWLRVLVTRWSYQHEFTIERVVAVERRLYGEIEVRGPDGTTYTRAVTGMPDVLLAGPGPEEATIIDWKTGFAPPARKREPTEEDPEPSDKLSDMGYVQQVVYGWLVMKNYPSIQRVTEREWYVMAKEDPVREASVERWEMERIEDVLAGVISQMDGAIASLPDLLRAQAKARRAKKPVPTGRFFPIPGSHCGVCVGRRHCPVRKNFGIPDTLVEAQRLAREWHVAGEIRTERIPYLKGWVADNGPIPVPHAKGRRVVGFRNGSRSLSLFEPESAPDSPFDPLLEEAARKAGVLSDA
jgi:hypothetical protein